MTRVPLRELLVESSRVSVPTHLGVGVDFEFIGICRDQMACPIVVLGGELGTVRWNWVSGVALA